MRPAAQLNPALSRKKTRGGKTRNAGHPLTAVSLFSGGGGIDLGFSAAGFNIACSSDIDPFSCATLAMNSGKKRFYKHVQSVPADIRELEAQT